MGRPKPMNGTTAYRPRPPRGRAGLKKKSKK